jgi:hypothetical protein
MKTKLRAANPEDTVECAPPAEPRREATPPATVRVETVGRLHPGPELRAAKPGARHARPARPAGRAAVSVEKEGGALENPGEVNESPRPS